MLPFIHQMKAMNKIVGKGIERPYINKRNHLMLGKGKKKTKRRIFSGGKKFGIKKIYKIKYL